MRNDLVRFGLLIIAAVAPQYAQHIVGMRHQIDGTLPQLKTHYITIFLMQLEQIVVAVVPKLGQVAP